MMEKSREARSSPSTGVSFFGAILDLTRLLWYLSIAGQLAWDLAPIIHKIQTGMVSDAQLPSSLEMVLRFVTVVTSFCNTTTWARFSMIGSMASIWWNPYLDPARKASKKRLKGFDIWYTHQVLMIVLRIIFYYAIRKNAAAEPMAPKILAAHVVAMAVFSYVRRSIPFSSNFLTFTVDHVCKSCDQD